MDITDRASKLLADALENNHYTKVRLSMRDTGGFDKALVSSLSIQRMRRR